MLTHDKIADFRVILEPVRHGVRPALAHTTSLISLQATTSTTTGHAVRDAMSVLVRDDVVLEGAVTFGLLRA